MGDGMLQKLGKKVTAYKLNCAQRMFGKPKLGTKVTGYKFSSNFLNFNDLSLRCFWCITCHPATTGT